MSMKKVTVVEIREFIQITVILQKQRKEFNKGYWFAYAYR